MKLKLTDNLFLRILSVVAAIVLWLVVVNINDAESTYTFSKGVALLNTEIITENGQVYRVESGTDVVKVTVRARKSILEKLSPSDFILTADMKKDLKYDSMVRINVECKNTNVNVERDVTLHRSNVQVSIEDAATEQFPVNVSHTGTPNDGLVIGSLIPEQTIIKITGPVSIVEQIKYVEAEVDVTGLPGSAVKTCSLKLYDAADNPIDTTYLNFTGKTDGIDVTVSLLNTKTLPLKFQYIGTPAENYEVKEISCKPDTVTIAGNAGVLSGLTRLEITPEAVNVDGISEDLQLVVDLTKYLPSGVILSEEYDASILVSVKVKYNAPEAEDGNSANGDSGGAKPSEGESGAGEENSSNNGNQDTTEKEDHSTNTDKKDEQNINKTEV